MTRMSTTFVLLPHQHITEVRKDRAAKKDVVYLVTTRSKDWIVLAQSIPLLCKWINVNLSNGEPWDKVSVTGLFESLDRTDGRYGGWHKGRFRIQSVPLQECACRFEEARSDYKRAAVVAGSPESYATD